MAETTAPRSTILVLTPALRRLLVVVLMLGGVMAVNSLYLLAVTVAERLSGAVLQNQVYLVMFFGHLVLGLVLMVPALVFGALHFRRARLRSNRYAIRAGVALYATLVALFVSGILLTRFGFFEVNDPAVRRVAYWVHVLTPVLAIWLFVLHRLAGPPLRWRTGVAWAGAAVGFAVLALMLHGLGLRHEPVMVRAFEPALAKVPDGARIEPARLMQDETCAECHADIAAQHAGSMHHLSSFNNPAYRASVDEARAVLLERDGNVQAARLCAACHDQVPLFAGRFDDPSYNPDGDPAGSAGIGCLGCHAITAVNSPVGNGDYSIAAPPRYPFADSDSAIGQFVHRQLIRAKPAFHKHTLLKPVLKSPEFCATCHKVHLPQALNHYRWLRGQNHYDSFLMSGVSGHRVDSFYYPKHAEAGCNNCHMPAVAAADPAARRLGGPAGHALAVHDHLFAAANTAVPLLMDRPAQENAARVEAMQKATRVDIFGLKDDGHIEGELHAPLRPELPTLQPGKRYLLEVVVRTTGMGHELTQGTVDSNELWLDVTLRAGGKVIARSGALGADGGVDDWAWYCNAYLLDRDGNRIARRNAQDIFVALYNHQIPPGAAAVVHYDFDVPADAKGPLTVDAALRYRKFDTRFYRFVEGERFAGNDLPITTLAADRVVLPVAGGAPLAADAKAPPDIPVWQRWNDYGIGLFREGPRGESRQAEAAFREVERVQLAAAEAAADQGAHQAVGQGAKQSGASGGDGAMNLTRVLHREGRLDEAAEALARAAAQGAPPWVVAWHTGLIARDQGDLDRAIDALDALAETRFRDARERGFDFSDDYRMLTDLGRTLYERARRERGAARRESRNAYLARARDRLQQALAIDPENAAAHYNMSLVLADLGDAKGAALHRERHEFYRTDDNAIERAVSIHRAHNPAANHAAEAVAIYALRPVAKDAQVAHAGD
ncbi:MAG: aspartate phosphatase [Thiohalocapsa sp.]|uniref:multiheme c-type cytochrome n=1 Tax=Thiohalocapsa sp. TaxID=2497641 RepID=UPI0025D937D3|nr:multiheme c-type cytochrome [Thiohalocapsa sp.]MCG6941610.1 aspartate phosphatase [Thiohalocapsa sp.]